MRFGILGALDVRTDDGTPLDPGGPRPGALLSLLLLDAGHAVSTQPLTDGLYGAEPPAGAANALQSQISRLRRRLAPHTDIEAGPTGYRVAVAPGSVDAHRFERLSQEGRAALAAGDHPRARRPCSGRRSPCGAARPCPTSRTRTPRPPGSTSSGWPPYWTGSRRTWRSMAAPNSCPSDGRWCRPTR